MINPLTWVRMAFRSAVRTEVERAMADRRVTINTLPVSDAEIARIRTFLGKAGVTPREPASIIPFAPANQNQPDPPPAA